MESNKNKDTESLGKRLGKIAKERKSVVENNPYFNNKFIDNNPYFKDEPIEDSPYFKKE